MGSKPVVSAIIASKGRFEMVRSLIGDLRGQDWPREKLQIVVIDDGSAPAYRFVDQDGVYVIRHDNSRGVQRSRNEGLAVATGSIALMLDDDIELLGTDFISKAVEVFIERSQVAVVFSRHIAVEHQQDEEFCWEQLMTRPTFYSGDLVEVHACYPGLCTGRGGKHGAADVPRNKVPFLGAVSDGEDIGIPGLHVLIYLHRSIVIGLDARFLGQRRIRFVSHGQNDRIRIKACAILQLHAAYLLFPHDFFNTGPRLYLHAS